MSELVPDQTGVYLRDLLGVPFTDEQLGIITAPLQPQLVIAGAGSGKTTIMAARVVHAVAFHGVAPSGVLGLTFTNKAANELAERVRKALMTLAASRTPHTDGLVPAEWLDDQPTVSTYHAYAASLVTDHALRIGREPDTTLLTEASRWQLALRVVTAGRGPYEHLDWTTPTVAQYVLDLDGELSEHLATAGEVRNLNAAVLEEIAGAPKVTSALRKASSAAKARDQLLELVEAYRERKESLDLLDFGDQVAIAAEIALRCPEVVAGERARFRVVFLDEYQDTGVAQRKLLAALFGSGHAVTAVGDPCQSIYGWRGASIGNLLRFPAHFPRRTGESFEPHYLLTSFRNARSVLDLANCTSESLRTYDDARRRPHVEVPPLRAGRPDVGRLHVARLLTIEDEAGWVADRIAEAIEAGTPPGEVAVLCRRRADFAAFHDALVRRDVPTEVVGLGGLLTMPEVGDVVSMLEVLSDPTANPALVRIMTGPRYRIGPRDLAALGARAAHLAQLQGPRTIDDPADDPDGTHALAAATAAVDPCDVVALTDALDDLGNPARYSAEGYARLHELAREIERLRPLVRQPVVECAAHVIAAIGLDIEIEALASRTSVARAANLSGFLDHAARFEGIEGESDLASFLAYLAAAREKEDGLDIGGVSTSDTVKLLTIHKAKGLEWQVVAVPCVVEGTFPPAKGRQRWPTSARVLPYPLRGDADDLPADPTWTNKGLEEFTDACRRDDLEEERRLAYVAFTRAKDLLLVTGHCWNRSRTTPCDPSPFLLEARAEAEAGSGAVDTWCDDAGDGNPVLADGVEDVAWPAPYDDEALARRRAAAELVVAALGEDASAEVALGQDALGEDALGEDALGAAPAFASADDERTAATWAREVGQLLDELLTERAPQRDVVLPRTLSASQVVQLAKDPDDLARSLARPMPRRPSSAARRGTAFHAWVEHLFDARPLFETDELADAADAALPSDAELEALKDAFAATPYADQRPAAVEAPFELLIGGRLVRGRIDAVYRSEDGGFDVVDYKTGLRPHNAEAAALQLAVYRLAWAEIAGVPVESVGAAFLYVASGELVRPRLADRAELATLFGGAADAAQTAADQRPVPRTLAPGRPGVTPEQRSARPTTDHTDEQEQQLTLDW